MLPQGVMPASVTPLTPQDQIDYPSLIKLFAYFTASNCQGIVLAGTNGEGPSLSAVEKRDLIRTAVPLADPLPIILGISTPSLTEATWLTSQAQKAGARAALVMPPSYFKSATDQGILDFFNRIADIGLPIIAYNFPKMTGHTMSPDFVHQLAQHPNIVGLKDSSADPANLNPYREALPAPKRLYTGAETLLLQALQHNWDGTISGAANTIPQWLSTITSHYFNNQIEQALTKHKLALPVIESIRSHPQPPTTKAVLNALNIINSPNPRLPLHPADPSPILSVLQSQLGITPQNLGLTPPTSPIPSH